MSIPIKINNRVIGKVENGVFIKNVIGSRHFLKKPPAIAFDISTLTKASQHGAITVKVKDTTTDIVYTSSMNKITEKGFEFDRGYGKQIALIMKEWKTNERTNSNN